MRDGPRAHSACNARCRLRVQRSHERAARLLARSSAPSHLVDLPQLRRLERCLALEPVELPLSESFKCTCAAAAAVVTLSFDEASLLDEALAGTSAAATRNKSRCWCSGMKM